MTLFASLSNWLVTVPFIGKGKPGGGTIWQSGPEFSCEHTGFEVSKTSDMIWATKMWLWTFKKRGQGWLYKFGSHQTTIFKVMEVYEINTGRELREREVIRFRNQVDPEEWG